VSRVDLSDPPRSSFAARKSWLLYHFFDHLCSYCLIQSTANLQQDHYEPRRYAEDRVHDPTNFLLGCGRCNGRGGKSDYHPEHHGRTRLPHDKTGFLILDVRRDDSAELFHLAPDGSISPREGPQQDRAAWNIAVLKLGLEPVRRRREQTLKLLQTCERILAALDDPEPEPIHDRLLTILDELLQRLAGEWLLLELHEVEASAEVVTRIRPIRDAGREHLLLDS
jgi:hypothetical protein